MIGSKTRREQAQEAGMLGGRPTNLLTKLKAEAREKSQRLVAGEQETCIKFLIAIRDNKRAPMRERVRCAVELLDRGEMPAKSASFHGFGATDEIGEIFGTPKLFVLEKYGTEKAAVEE